MNALRLVWQLLLPTRCVLCQKLGGSVVCPSCLSALERVGPRHCLRCGRRRETTFASPDCGECSGRSLGVTRARSLYIYNAAGRALLGEFKYRHQLGAGSVLADALGNWVRGGFQSLFEQPDLALNLVVPVPLHAKRLRARRFNQALYLARTISKAADVPCLPGALARIRETPSQVGLSAAQRQQNVRGAFAVPLPRASTIASKAVLLVDDLMTTGATLGACARALRRSGSGPVYALTLFSTHRGVAADDTPPGHADGL